MKWYQRKSFYVPFSIVMGILGFGAWFASLLGVNVDEELNKDYFTTKDEPLFKKKK
ncbi:hypothetical protein [Tetragenococcus koreensis]|uniref:Uncharacterized protein n=1 Tax=Tetragenococcus koreensis TaxID=290335 RepID=A0AAN4RJ01_9ENTE|nr:hypothetical protein [Tetragenococcus koreensis]MCF1626261.1 hypothetical protein [Tetragenococcus koreensis]MCF1630820.1 hypothetical protein [Tetragenococcus koreensis]GEQ48574.1 hypothetical protein TK11N_04260 [Tetragenococcus koreensis]GEQ51003.1 hypothetical protein TK12N_03470 [Tetragenococcus koreensis]GEQ53582.1 hypothetical protein TK2N_04260 [Tetragenococcus koreensis]